MLQPGTVVLADKGLSSKGMERYCAGQAGVLLVRPDHKDEKRHHGNLAGVRNATASRIAALQGELTQSGPDTGVSG